MAGGVLSPGELAARAGTSVSALHFYEREGLIHSERTAGNQRRYPRTVLRRIALIRIARRAGIPLQGVRRALAHLPTDRAPGRADWQALSAAWRADLDDRIHRLQQVRDSFADCIGCGCLSLDHCALANPDDLLGSDGPGARLLAPPAVPSTETRP